VKHPVVELLNSKYLYFSIKNLKIKFKINKSKKEMEEKSEKNIRISTGNKGVSLKKFIKEV